MLASTLKAIADANNPQPDITSTATNVLNDFYSYANNMALKGHYNAALSLDTKPVPQQLYPIVIYSSLIPIFFAQGSQSYKQLVDTLIVQLRTEGFMVNDFTDTPGKYLEVDWTNA